MESALQPGDHWLTSPTRNPTAARPTAGRRPLWSGGLGLLLLTPLTLWLVIAFALPMGTVGLLSLQVDTSIFATPSLDLTAEHLWSTVSDPYYLAILAETLGIGLVVTLGALLLGLPVAAWLARLPPRWRPLGVVIVLIPLLTNVVVRSLGLMQFLAPGAWLSESLGWLLGLPDLNLLFTPGAVVVALIQVFMPFLIMAVYDSLSDRDPALSEAAASLGARPVTGFLRVVLPLILPGLRAGVSIVFLLATTSYVSATLLGGKKVWMLGMVIFDEAMQIQNYPQASALALVLLSVCVVGSWLIHWLFARLMPWERGALRRFGGLPPGWGRLWDSALEALGPWLARLGLLLGLGLLVFPLFLVVVNSVNDVPQATAGVWRGFTLEWYRRVLWEGSAYLEAGWVSLQLALAATTVAVVLALPAAFALVRRPPLNADTLMAIYLLPLALPGIAYALGILKLLQLFLLIPPFLGLVLVHATLILPFTLGMLRVAVARLDRAPEEAAASLGAGPLLTFVRVTLPALGPGLAASAIIAFLVSFGEVTVTAFLTTARLQTLPVRIYADVQFDVLPTVNAVSTVLIVLTVGLLLGLGRWMPLERVWRR